MDAATTTQQIRSRAEELGFDAVGIACVEEPLSAEFAHYEAFVEAGFHGSMKYLAENREARRTLRGSHMLLGARSVICLAQRYPKNSSTPLPDDSITSHVARYARGADYHNFLRRKIRRLAAFVRSLGTEDAPVHARPLSDDAPILERAWAARAGLGFVGKNGLLIIPGHGSMLLLGEVITTLTLVPGEPMAQRCGSCTRCLETCPTQAFVKPFVLNASRCISYFTIEHQGAIANDDKAAIGEHLFGCDDCQTVCPFNASERPFETKSQFEPLERWSTLRLVEMLAMQPDALEPLLSGSPLKRASADGLVRNACIVLGNRREASAQSALVQVATGHQSASVRDAATWALESLTAPREP